MLLIVLERKSGQLVQGRVLTRRGVSLRDGPDRPGEQVKFFFRNIALVIGKTDLPEMRGWVFREPNRLAIAWLDEKGRVALSSLNPEEWEVLDRVEEEIAREIAIDYGWAGPVRFSPGHPIEVLFRRLDRRQGRGALPAPASEKIPAAA